MGKIPHCNNLILPTFVRKLRYQVIMPVQQYIVFKDFQLVFQNLTQSLHAVILSSKLSTYSKSLISVIHQPFKHHPPCCFNGAPYLPPSWRNSKVLDCKISTTSSCQSGVQGIFTCQRKRDMWTKKWKPGTCFRRWFERVFEEFECDINKEKK